jgi:hypothetical protein
MVKIIPWDTVCKKCNVKLEYYNEDIINRNVISGMYHDFNTYELRGYIKCPVCGCEIRVK